MSAPYTLKWGIISTGGIASSFTSDLLVDPTTRDVKDVKHEVVAVGSRSVESAQAFIDKMKKREEGHPSLWGVKNGVLDNVKPYGSYGEVYADPNVNAVYIGTPHTLHYAAAKDALKAGKNVLCEKPVTFDLEELDELLSLAKQNNLFFMEAVWTRFQPIAYDVQELIHSGKLGKVKRFLGDCAVDFQPENMDDAHRIINPDLGGGALLDLGPYAAVWAMLVLHHHPDNTSKTAPKIVSSHQTVFKRTGVDYNSWWRLEWDNGHQADCSASLGYKGLDDATTIIQCQKGTVTIQFGPFRPPGYWVLPADSKSIEGIPEKKRFEAKSHPGGAMHYQADEVARCIRDGKKQSGRMSWEESRIVQGMFDEVRKRGDTVLKDVKGQAGK